MWNTYFRPVSSFPKKWMTTVLKTKLENTVNNPAIPGEGGEMECWSIFFDKFVSQSFVFQSEWKARKQKNPSSFVLKLIYIKIMFYIKSTDNILWQFKQLKLETSTRKTVATNQWWLYSQNKSVWCEKKCLLLSKTGKTTTTNISWYWPRIYLDPSCLRFLNWK